MRKLVVSTFLTLDGIMQAPGGPEEDPTGGFKYGGWSANYWDDMMGQVMGESMAKPSDLLLGRKTYEIFAAYWPYAKYEPAAAYLNNAKKYVASRTLNKVEWNNSTLLKGDVTQEIRKLKQQAGPDLWVQGSSNLIQTLQTNKLIDNYYLWIFPVVIGYGKRLFDKGSIPSDLKLMDSKTSTTGVIIATFVPVGELNPGSMVSGNPSKGEIARRKRLISEG